MLAHEVEDDELHNRHRQSQTFDHKLANRRQSNGGRSNRRRWRFVSTPTTPVIPDTLHSLRSLTRSRMTNFIIVTAIADIRSQACQPPTIQRRTF
ncbi:hypothetical protein HNQ96_006363 [Aminobacter lissarensis]|uniref:Uncharacterized protein n=1 Tax=Aminobacter carboxidus TaxID=376165 RepID=A0A8E1WMM2_9HYPH|nr:hypothetical protein [Aminobacter lissarensis]